MKRGIKSEPRKVLFAKHTPSNIECVGQGALSQLDLRQQVWQALQSHVEIAATLVSSSQEEEDTVWGTEANPGLMLGAWYVQRQPLDVETIYTKNTAPILHVSFDKCVLLKANADFIFFKGAGCLCLVLAGKYKALMITSVPKMIRVFGDMTQRAE